MSAGKINISCLKWIVWFCLLLNQSFQKLLRIVSDRPATIFSVNCKCAISNPNIFGFLDESHRKLKNRHNLQSGTNTIPERS